MTNGVSVAGAQNKPAQGLGTPQNRPMTQKIDFFKVRDIDTPIQPRKKKHQTNVSSALKHFRTTCGISETIAKILIFASHSTFLQEFLQKRAVGGQKSKFLRLSQRRRKWS